MEELAEITEIPFEKLAALTDQFSRSNCLSLDQLIGKSESTELIELIPSDEQTTFEAIAHQNIKDLLDSVLEELTPKEAIVIRLRYGLEDGERKTLNECGQAIGVSRERARQLESRALKKLRQHSELMRLRGVA